MSPSPKKETRPTGEHCRGAGDGIGLEARGSVLARPVSRVRAPLALAGHMCPWAVLAKPTLPSLALPGRWMMNALWPLECAAS